MSGPFTARLKPPVVATRSDRRQMRRILKVPILNPQKLREFSFQALNLIYFKELVSEYCLILNVQSFTVIIISFPALREFQFSVVSPRIRSIVATSVVPCGKNPECQGSLKVKDWQKASIATPYSHFMLQFTLSSHLNSSQM